MLALMTIIRLHIDLDQLFVPELKQSHINLFQE